MKRLRLLLLLGVWGAVLAVGLAGVELYARKAQGYLLWSPPLQKRQPYFFELDRLKVYNRKFYEERRRYFVDWPIPLELFDADKPTPRYLFKPNLRMAWHGTRLEPAKPGEEVFRSTNSWGFRGPEFSIEKPAGVIRIVCLGASTTEGSHGDLETYPHFLQQELTRMFVGQKIEVLNAGYHGQLLEDLLEILRQRVLPVKPDLVIFYEASNNIIWNEFSRGDLSCHAASCASKIYSGIDALLRRHSALYVLVAKRFGWAGHLVRPMWHEFDDTSPKPAAVRYKDVLRQIVRETLDSGSRIVLSTFVTLAHEGLTVRYEDNPLVFDYLHKTLYPFSPGEIQRVYEYYNQRAREIATEHRVLLVDMAREFPRDSGYFPFDVIHFSPAGNKVLAGILARHLRDGVLPELMTRDAR